MLRRGRRSKRQQRGSGKDQQVDPVQAEVDVANACKECVVVEPDDADVDEGDGEGAVVGPPFEQARPELGLVERWPVDLENEEGDRDSEHGVAEGLDASALGQPTVPCDGWRGRAHRSNGR